MLAEATAELRPLVGYAKGRHSSETISSLAAGLTSHLGEARCVPSATAAAAATTTTTTGGLFMPLLLRHRLASWRQLISRPHPRLVLIRDQDYEIGAARLAAMLG